MSFSLPLLPTPFQGGLISLTSGYLVEPANQIWSLGQHLLLPPVHTLVLLSSALAEGEDDSGFFTSASESDQFSFIWTCCCTALVVD